MSNTTATTPGEVVAASLLTGLLFDFPRAWILMVAWGAVAPTFDLPTVGYWVAYAAVWVADMLKVRITVPQ